MASMTSQFRRGILAFIFGWAPCFLFRGNLQSFFYITFVEFQSNIEKVLPERYIFIRTDITILAFFAKSSIHFYIYLYVKNFFRFQSSLQILWLRLSKIVCSVMSKIGISDKQFFSYKSLLFYLFLCLFLP